MKSTYCQLAENYKDQSVLGWFASEKLDGMRCIWDGGVSRGDRTKNIPWANKNQDRVSTGLWSRLGHVITAPEDWIEKLPRICLDGELYSKIIRQEIMSIVKRHSPDDRWDKINYCVFDSPAGFECYRTIKEIRFEQLINPALYKPLNIIRGRYRDVYGILSRLAWPSNCRLVEQVPINSLEELNNMLEAVIEAGGEGLMLRDPQSFNVCYRSKQLLKVKRCSDAEGVVIGWSPGVGKLAGLCGSLKIKSGEAIFDCRGLTDSESELGEDSSLRPWPVHFPAGTVITYKYNGLSSSGIPQFPRYWRKYDN
jgi:DNA ligase 1